MHGRCRRASNSKNSINRLTPNLIIRHLSLPLLGLDRHNLSSRNKLSRMNEMLQRENEFVRSVAGVDEKFEIALFEYKNEVSGLKLTHWINRLSSYEDQDILSWYILFRETALICNWTHKVQYEVLRQIVDVNLQLMIGVKNNVDDILLCLLK
ncbi:hypothetical protein DMUE_4412 [Dictyocoela muelleri]|nr:hypothetical protein DMUE_4412 [Dictyocoela muelleri]